MKTKFLIPLIIILIGFLIWFFSSSQVIKRRTNTILESLELSEGSSRIARVTKSHSLKKILEPQIRITYPQGANIFGTSYPLSEPITISNDQAATAHSYLTESMDYMKTENTSFEITSIDSKVATVQIQFTLITKQKKALEKSVTLTGILTFNKNEKTWLLDSAEFSK